MLLLSSWHLISLAVPIDHKAAHENESADEKNHTGRKLHTRMQKKRTVFIKKSITHQLTPMAAAIPGINHTKTASTRIMHNLL